MDAETNNYYTPDISEFHIGFKFERSTYNSEEWTTTTFESYMNLHNLAKDIEKSNIRVRYLSEEALANQGFIKEGSFKYTNSPKDLFLYWHGSDKQRGARIALYLDKYSDSTCHIHLFDGYIKNETEFKKLLEKICF